jgi:hypothetical protein
VGAFTGDPAKLGQLVRNLGKLATVPSRLAEPVAEALGEQIRSEYEASTDPYGNAWAELMESTLQRKGGDDRIKIRSGEELSGIEVLPMSGAGVSVTLADYEGFHTGGTKHMEARPSLPTGTMPATWRKVIDDARDKLIAEAKTA